LKGEEGREEVKKALQKVKQIQIINMFRHMYSYMRNDFLNFKELYQGAISEL